MRNPDVVESITELADALKEPWCTRMKEHVEEQCSWFTTFDHGILCTTHNVVVAPGPDEAKPSEVFKDPTQVVPFLILMMTQLQKMYQEREAGE